MFKARLAQEADGEDIDNKFVTMSYLIMKEFKYSIHQIKDMYATTFFILIDEMEKDALNQDKEMKKSKNKTIK